MRLIFTLALMAASAMPALAAPTSAKLTFRYNGGLGNAVVSTTYDQPTTRRCTITFRAAVSSESDPAVRVARRIAARYNIRRGVRRVVFRIRGLQAIQVDSSDAVLTMQSRTVCRDDEIVSNSIARFLICGTGSESVAPSTFLDELFSKTILIAPTSL